MLEESRQCSAEGRDISGRNGMGALSRREQERLPALRLNLSERFALVPRCPDCADDPAEYQKSGQDPGQAREACVREDRHEEAPEAKADTDDGKGDALCGAAE